MNKTSARQTAGICFLAPSHIPALQILASDPAVAATTRLPHPYPPDGARQFVEQQQEERAAGRAHVFAIQDGDILVGVCGLHGVALGEAHELGYWIGREYWGRGYATFAVKMVLLFAFQNLALTRIGSAVLESNAASHRVLLKNGFRLLRVQPHHDPALKRPDERQAVYEITRAGWLDFRNGPVVASLHPALRSILQAELAAGNEILETGGGWPDADSVFVKLRDRFRVRPDPIPASLDYTEPNSPHWWFADYSSRSPRHILAC